MQCTISCSKRAVCFLLLIALTLSSVYYFNLKYLQTISIKSKPVSNLVNVPLAPVVSPNKPETFSTSPNRDEPEVTSEKKTVEKKPIGLESFMLDAKLEKSTVITRSETGWSSDDGCCEGDKNFVKTTLHSPAGDLPIYVHPSKDDMWVSGEIIKGGMWEKGTVIKFYDILKIEKDLQFIDIGANIGIYGLTMAKIGIKVLLVEPFLKNVQKLCSSIKDGGLRNTYVLHNALSSSRHPVGFGTYHGNIGGTFVRNVTGQSEESTYAVLLDDVLEVFNFTKVAIKLDVETHEAQVLMGATAFFKKVDVRYLMVEWHKDKEKTGLSIIEFLTGNNMLPYHPTSGVALDTNNRLNWPGDIFWKKKQ